ncbi:hypothetical protein [Mesobacillus jeotgali]|uniref:Uncharacterized protein n=1 Tax=Mesobacillus jeotgali TaxID=129985 RepID=A0ABY9VDN7_9BACI|nr:hypothetical protein [Mesobacillus jeotgali]WNF21329.1 hypothetical protein RH061_14105 [Mesobacillus jeotgali]
MRIEFTVFDTPPKKSGANSMWNSKSERSRIISLRKKAYEASLEYGEIVKKNYIGLEVILFIPNKKDIFRIGDLDNFIGGICDGLQAASYSALKYIDMKDKELQNVYPHLPIFIENDNRVVFIKATKNYSKIEQIHYRIILSFLSELNELDNELSE